MATKERLIIEQFLQVVNKDGEEVPFVLNSAQAQIDNNLTRRSIIPKARQEGVSTYFLARKTVKCLYKPNTRAVVISHDAESTQRMFAKVRYFLDNMRHGVRPVYGSATKNHITFPKTNSIFYIGTAGSRKFGRGDTITDLHCSEAAFWENPKDLTAGLFQAVPKNGEIHIESTGNGMGNWYHQRCMDALESHSRFRLHFLPWHTFEEYQEQCTPEEKAEILNDPKLDWEEPELLAAGLSPERLKWRRGKLQEMDYDIHLFKQEYPMTLDECFQSTGQSIFYRTYHTDIGAAWIQVDQNLHLKADHPMSSSRYIIGADVAAGVEKDNSVAQILWVNQNGVEQVGEWASNKCSPDYFAEKLAELGAWFNNAYIACESNNHGILTLYRLEEVYPHYLVHTENAGAQHRLGLRTTAATKPLWVGLCRQMVAEGLVTHSEGLRNEMSTFVEAANGRLQAAEGCRDDRVMALVMACVAYANAGSYLLPPTPVLQSRKNDPFSMEHILMEFHGNGPDEIEYKRSGSEDLL